MAYKVGGVATSYGLHLEAKSQVHSLQVLWKGKAMVVCQKELAGDGIRKRGGHYVDSIQGRVSSGIFVELKEEYTLRVAFQERKESLVL